jgi:SPP1 family predicted phage head-tail adaptor
MTAVGQLSERVTIQRPIETLDGVGQAQQSWVTVATVPASLETPNADELYAARQVGLSVTHRVVIRYRTDVLASAGKWRVLWREQEFGIAGVRDSQGSRRRFLELTCTAVMM